MNQSAATNLLYRLDRDNSMQLGKAPNPVRRWIGQLSLPGELRNFLVFSWPQNNHLVGAVEWVSSENLLKFEHLEIYVKAKLLPIGCGKDGDVFCIDFSEKSCPVGFVSKQNFFGKGDPRCFFLILADSVESFLYQVVEGESNSSILNEKNRSFLLSPYGEVTKPFIFWRNKIAVLTPTLEKSAYVFGGSLPRIIGGTNGAIVHNLFTIIPSACSLLKAIKFDEIHLIFPFRHDGGEINYTILSNGEVKDISVDPKVPEEDWPYSSYPNVFREGCFECSAIWDVSKEDALDIFPQVYKEIYDDNFAIFSIPSTDVIPESLWGEGDDNGVNCVFFLNVRNGRCYASPEID